MPDQPPPWHIVFYKDGRGRSPITDYLNALPVAEQAAAEEAFRLLREFGVSVGMPHAKLVSGKLWDMTIPVAQALVSNEWGARRARGRLRRPRRLRRGVVRKGKTRIP